MAKDASPAANEPRAVTVVKTDRQMSTIRFSPSGKLLAAAGRDATIRVWDIEEPKPAEGDLLEAVESDPKKKPAKNAPAKKPPEPKFAERPQLTGHNGWVTSITFQSQDDRLFSADSWGELRCWNLADASSTQPVWQVKDAHDGWVRQLAISADGQRLATCGMDKKIQLWNAKDGQKLQTLAGDGEDIFSVAFHPDGKSLVAGDMKGVVKQWDLATGKVVRGFDVSPLYMLSFIQDVGGARTLSFDREGTFLAVGGIQPTGGGFVQGGPLIRIFDWKTGNEVRTLKPGDATDGFVHELAFHPNGYWLGAVSGQPGKGKFILLRPNEEQPFFTSKLANCHSVAIHPNGVRVAVISNEGIAGQQKSKAREGIYPGNISPINIWDLPATTA